MQPIKKPLYLFLDESGNFDFSNKGTEYYTITCFRSTRPFCFNPFLDGLKHNLIEFGLDIEFFHATEDKNNIRNRVYKILQDNLSDLIVDSIVVEKRKTHPKLQKMDRFYPEMMGYLLKYVFNGIKIDDYSEIIIIIDSVPSHRKNILFAAIKTHLHKIIDRKIKYRILTHSSKSNYCLQIVDYCNYAIFRKWERKDLQYYDLIKPGIRSEFEIFQRGNVIHY